MPAALTRTRQPSHVDHDPERTHAHPLDAFVPNPAELSPMCEEPEFAAILEEMVADEAPRLFAVVQEYGERVDGRIVAWGMAFPDRAEIVSVERTSRMSLRAPEDVLRMFNLGSHIRARLVWLNPDATAPAKEDEAT
ncbi:hypothetical protein [Actinoalloteichus spitiensis]|uniref:hypothetical protein n=1 Tax=Actinoalloteichus spitiensis TaxID=252394 RepID=UPI001FE217CD|nr:hypothetical protein [Actinoalloteichus spitiensis]